jgi:hypothetical protein
VGAKSQQIEITVNKSITPSDVMNSQTVQDISYSATETITGDVVAAVQEKKNLCVKEKEEEDDDDYDYEWEWTSSTPDCSFENVKCPNSGSGKVMQITGEAGKSILIDSENKDLFWERAECLDALVEFRRNVSIKNVDLTKLAKVSIFDIEKVDFVNAKFKSLLFDEQAFLKNSINLEKVFADKIIVGKKLTSCVDYKNYAANKVGGKSRIIDVEIGKVYQQKADGTLESCKELK